VVEDFRRLKEKGREGRRKVGKRGRSGAIVRYIIFNRRIVERLLMNSKSDICLNFKEGS
jgi:hypothetical protein